MLERMRKSNYCKFSNIIISKIFLYRCNLVYSLFSFQLLASNWGWVFAPARNKQQHDFHFQPAQRSAGWEFGAWADHFMPLFLSGLLQVFSGKKLA